MVGEINSAAPLSTRVKPTVTTTRATSITQSTAFSGGDVTKKGAITACGVCWSNSGNPIVTGNHATYSIDSGKFTSVITGLNAGTTYYVRAYATNSAGTAYGKTDTFETHLAATLKIGQKYQGGIIGYILQAGDAGYNTNVQHGLIAALKDQSAGMWWYNGTYVTTGATDAAIGSGAANTALIIAAQGAGIYAASICTAYSGGGYTDWYLPTTDELHALWANIGQGATGADNNIGGFANSGYWSSTEYDIEFAWDEAFNLGGPNGYSKNGTNYVRAIRAF